MNQISTSQINSWIGTKFCHMGRKKASQNNEGGVDCLGVTLDVLAAAGIYISDEAYYPEYPTTKYAEKLILEFDKKLTRTNYLSDGCIVLFKIGSIPCHLGILINHQQELYVVHAFRKLGYVVKHRLDEFWKAKIAVIWKMV